MRNNLVEIICQESQKNKDIIFVTADLGFNVLNDLYKKFPDQFINVGIAEQNMTSVAAGLSLEGKKVFTYSIGSFSTLRCLEQIRNDICYHNLDVKIVALAAGFAYGALGMSHHATEDIACMKVLPNMTIFSPCDPIETRAVTRAAIQMKSPCYIRLGRGGEKNIHENNEVELNFVVGKAFPLSLGNDGCIFSTGAITSEAQIAVKELRKKGYHLSLYSFPTIKPLDEDLVKQCALIYDFIIVVEEHQINGGFASSIADVLSNIYEKHATLKRIGMKDQYTSLVGDTNYLRQQYKMDAKEIIRVYMENKI